MTNPVAQERFTEMKTAMLMHTPFFASLLLSTLTLKVGKFPDIPTAGTDGRNVLFDEDFLAAQPLAAAVGLCCHEVAHCMWQHMARAQNWMDTGFDGQPFNPGVFNVAADYVINDMLKKSGITLPDGALLNPRYTGDMLVDAVYRELIERMPPDQGSVGESGGAGGQPNNAGMRGAKPMDSHIYAPSEVSPAEMTQAIAVAAHHAKAMGRFPAGMERWVDKILHPQVNWQEHLRYLITVSAGRDATTWTRPHKRRLVVQKIYMPKYTGISAGEIVCVVDTSGSMGTKEFDAAWAEFSDIITTCHPERVWLMDCDAAVHNVHELESYTDIYAERPAMTGGGGTDFEPAFRKVEDLAITPAVLVYFTDGLGSFPKVPPDYPVIWVMTTDAKPPFGDVVKVEV